MSHLHSETFVRSQPSVAGYTCFALVILLSPLLWFGQQAAAQPVLANAVQQPRGGEGSPAPPPGDEVMQPTAHGVRFSPDLSRGFAGTWIRENLGDAVELTSDQRDRLSKAIADRMMTMARQQPRETENFFDGLISTMIATEGGTKMTAADARRFAEAMQPIMPSAHEFLNGVAQDAAGVLDSDQQAAVRKQLDRRHKKLDQVAVRLERWGKGEFKDEERGRLEELFDPDRDVEEDAAEKASDQNTGKNQFRMPMRRARMFARSEVDRVGPGEWQRFVSMAKTGLKLTPEQSAKADKLLGEYRSKAAGLMSADWKRRLRENRLKNYLQWNMADQPTAPWVFHLEREYDELVGPVLSLQKELYAKVLALATDEQRSALLGDVAVRAAEHGLILSEADRVLLMAALK